MLSYPSSHYVVNGAPACGPARTNEGFDTFNCYLTYNSQEHRMELRTKAPIPSGLYEALTNYDIPGCPPSYWTPDRRDKLPQATTTKCSSYYPSRTAPARKGPLVQNISPLSDSPLAGQLGTQVSSANNFTCAENGEPASPLSHLHPLEPSSQKYV